MKNFCEADVRCWVRDHWPGWVEFYEAAHGGSPGVPDVQFMLNGLLLPAELKVGTLRDGFVLPKRVRPAQVGWHMRFAAAGGTSLILIGVQIIDYICVMIIPGTLANEWRVGYEITKENKMISSSMFRYSISKEFEKLSKRISL